MMWNGPMYPSWPLRYDVTALRENELLQPSLWDDLSDRILEQLLDTKELIEKWKNEWKCVVLVHLSGDLMHSAHVQYMNVIRAKVSERVGIPDTEIRLVVWVEADSRTEMRKGKKNINSQDERRYNFANLKAVDHAYIEFEGVASAGENEERPAWIVKYLAPSVLITHEEHTPVYEEYFRMFRRMYASTGGITIAIRFDDIERYLWEQPHRDMFGRSTTNTIRQIFDAYRWNSKYDLPPKDATF